MQSKFSFGGPGMIIAAAFIGPGTVTMCTLAGAGYGLQLLWAVLLSIILTIFFQEMASRLGVITQLDLTVLVKRQLPNRVIRWIILGVILSAIVIGNGAYEAGNISGGALGMDTLYLLTLYNINFAPIGIGLLAGVILWFGNQKVLTTSLTILVVLMSGAFVISAIMVQPNVGSLLTGLFVPKTSKESLLTVLGVVGTTVVPYNLFLHASLAKTRWKQPEDLIKARKDIVMAVVIGGLVSMAIVITASALKDQPIRNALDMAEGLTPFFGASAKYLIGIGLFSAGITSAITAPLAAAHVMAGVFGWRADHTSQSFRLTWMSLLSIGVLFASIGFKPVAVIRFAQVTNGLILPIMAVLLVWLCSQSSILGLYKNKPITTIIGVCMTALIAVLGIKSIWLVL